MSARIHAILCRASTGLLLATSVMTVTSALGQTATWDGGGDGVRWCDANNWQPDVVFSGQRQNQSDRDVTSSRMNDNEEQGDTLQSTVV